VGPVGNLLNPYSAYPLAPQTLTLEREAPDPGTRSSRPWNAGQARGEPAHFGELLLLNRIARSICWSNVVIALRLLPWIRAKHRLGTPSSSSRNSGLEVDQRIVIAAGTRPSRTA